MISLGIRAETRALIPGGGDIRIFVFCPTNLFWNELKNNWFQKKFVGQNANIWIFTPPPPALRFEWIGNEHYLMACRNTMLTNLGNNIRDMFVMLFWVYIHTGQAEKSTWPRYVGIEPAWIIFEVSRFFLLDLELRLGLGTISNLF